MAALQRFREEKLDESGYRAIALTMEHNLSTAEN